MNVKVLCSQIKVKIALSFRVARKMLDHGKLSKEVFTLSLAGLFKELLFNTRYCLLLSTLFEEGLHPLQLYNVYVNFGLKFCANSFKGTEIALSVKLPCAQVRMCWDLLPYNPSQICRANSVFIHDFHLLS